MKLQEEIAMNDYDDPWLDEFLGWTYMDLGECELAVELFSRALSVDPSIESAEQGIRECGG